jgi:hypothetical protein
VRIPAKMNAHSGHRERESGQGDRASERSDEGSWSRDPPQVVGCIILRVLSSSSKADGARLRNRAVAETSVVVESENVAELSHR